MKSKEEGTARRVEWRKEEPYTILTFRLEQRDEDGNLNYIPVELSELQVKGRVVDGDNVEVIGEVDEEGILRPKSIRNLRTQAHIKATKFPKMMVIPFIFFGIAAIFMMLNFIISDFGPVSRTLFGLTGLFILLFIISSAIIIIVYHLKR